MVHKIMKVQHFPERIKGKIKFYEAVTIDKGNKLLVVWRDKIKLSTPTTEKEVKW